MTGREARAALDRPGVAGQGEEVRTPANLPPATRRSVGLPIFAAASLLIHIGVIGALIADFRSSQGKARRSTAIEVEVVHDPLAALFRHPTLPKADERAVLSRAAAEASLVAPRSAGPVLGADRADGGGIAAAIEPRPSDDLKEPPLGAKVGERALPSQGIVAVPLVPTPSAEPVIGGDHAESRGIVAGAVEPRPTGDAKVTSIDIKPSDAPLRSGGTAEASIVPAGSAEPVTAADHPGSPASERASIEPRASDDLDLVPLNASTPMTTPAGNHDLVLATTTFASLSAGNPMGAFAPIEASVPATLSPWNATNKSLSDRSLDRPSPVAASSPAVEAATIVAASEPPRSGDLREASLRVGAGAPALAGHIDLALPTTASDGVATRNSTDAFARIEMSAPVAHPVETGGNKLPSDWPGADLRPTTAPLSASEAAGLVPSVEPRRSDDLKEAPLRRSAALLGPAGIALRASLAPMPGLAPTLVGLRAQYPLASDAPARSVTSEAAGTLVAVTAAAVTPDEARTAPRRWDSADLRPDPASPVAEVGETAIDGRPLAFDSGGDRDPLADPAVAAPLLVSQAGAVVSPVATVSRYDEKPAPEKPASDDVVSIFPAPLVTKRTSTIPAVVTIPILRPSTAGATATKDEESQAANTAGGSLALGGLDAPWAPWGVQIASSFSLDQALASFAAIQQEFPGASIQLPLVMRNVDRSRGWAPLYQIRIPATDQESAKSICSRLEAAKGACVVLRN